MELVYLWVEDYKNIKRQGFNFSPRFECKYENNELTICDKKKKKCKDNDYIENFFGDNIHITAIVGKNGSGKSSILDLLYEKLHDFDFHGFAIFNNKNDEIFFLKSLHDNYPFLDIYRNLSKNNKETLFPLFDYSYTYDINPLSNNELKYPKKRINSINGIIDLNRENIRNQRNILRNYFSLKEKKQLSKFDNFFTPKTITIYFNPSTIKAEEGKNIPKLREESKNKLEQLSKNIRGNISFQDFFSTLKEVSKLLNNSKSYEELSNIFDYFKPNFQLGIDKLNDELDISFNNIWNQKDFNNLEKLSILETIQFSNENPYEEDYSIKLLSFSIENLDNEIIDTILASFSSNHFLINLYDESKKRLNDLSFGEQQLLSILNQLYSLGMKKSINIEDKVDTSNQIIIDNNFDEELDYRTSMPINYILLFDEIDISFHPDWQKKTVQYIVDFLSLIDNMDFHLIFTTHSPFLLSDIPKQNTIFLDTYDEKKSKDKYPNLTFDDFEDGNCINVTKELDIKSFGANIHNLLAHGFFMEDGLMGEFAKKKIENIVKFYNDVKNGDKKQKDYNEVKKEFYFIRNNIGEEYIKGVITNHIEFIEEKLVDEEFKKRRIEQLEIELARLRGNNDKNQLS